MRKSALAVLCLLILGCRSGPTEPPPTSGAGLADQVRIVTRPSQTVLSLACTGDYAQMDAQIERLVAKMETDGIEPAGPLQAVFHDDPATTSPDKTRYEVWMPVAPGTKAAVPFAVKAIPDMKTAAVVLVGPYEKISERYGELFDWVAEHGYEIAGPLLEVYLVGPGTGVPPARYETEVHVPVRAR